MINEISETAQDVSNTVQCNAIHNHLQCSESSEM